MSPLPQDQVEIETRSAEETKRLGVAISPLLVPGDVLALSGDLGAGKTTFVQGLAAGLKITERVTSPTFVLMKEYLDGAYPFMHFDIYRLKEMQEILDLGYEELLDPSHVVAVEWGHLIEPLLPAAHLLVELSLKEEPLARNVRFEGRGADWLSRMKTLRILTGELFSPARELDELEGIERPNGRSQ